jgi:SAM-dependent methyltransferase
VLSRILPPGARALATEEWGRNAPVAAQRLADLGVGVVRAPSTALPLRAASFDLVLARHEAIRPAEVARVLAPGGRFLTQQCTHDDWCELRRFFPAMAHFADHAVEYRREFRAAGLELEAWREHRGTVRFRELGPLVYWPAASPWLLPHFDLDADAESIRALEGEIDREGGVTLREGRYLLQVRRPPA